MIIGKLKMNYMKRIIISVVLIGVHFMTAFAGSEQGNRGPLYLLTAWNLAKGDFNLHAASRFYFNNKSYNLPDNTTAAVTFWDVQGGMNLYYGIGKNYQIGLSQIIYQDNHKSGKGYNLPDDLFLNVKIGSFPSKPGAFNFGVNILTRFPLANYHNIQLEPYSAGRVAFGILGLASYAGNQVFHEDGFNAHLNLGIIDHNDNGIKLGESDEITYANPKTTRELYGGMAIIMPTTQFDFSLELYGNYNISKPPPTAYSRHSYLYITPGVTYKPFYWLSLCCGFDFRLSPNKSNSSDLIKSGLTNMLPTYPTWRVNFGMKVNLTSKIQSRFEEKSVVESAPIESQKGDVFKNIADERKQIENAEAELEKIRSEREKMDEILKRLRKALEIKESEKKKDDKKD